jgi:hypothetical protein
VLNAEALGYDSTLVAQHTINPHSQALDHSRLREYGDRVYQIVGGDGSICEGGGRARIAENRRKNEVL